MIVFPVVDAVKAVNGFTVIVNVSDKAHCPAVGVKLYVVVVALFNAGDHVPVTLFVDVVGKGLNVSPAQIAATLANVGVTTGLTVMVNVCVVAHCPAVGVKL